LPKISEQKREARRQQILAAALACFSDDGFHQTGMADIVARSGLSHGAVYLYFQSKDDLIAALADDRHRREAVLNSVARHSGNPLNDLRALVDAYTQWLVEPAGEARRRVGVHGWAEALRNERVRAGVVEGIDAARAAITNLVARAQHDRLIRREVDADAVARMLVATFQGFVLQTVWGEKLDVKACRGAVEQMLSGLEIAPGPVRPARKARA
jgi:AcrR family transcriptional regulator